MSTRAREKLNVTLSYILSYIYAFFMHKAFNCVQFAQKSTDKGQTRVFNNRWIILKYRGYLYYGIYMTDELLRALQFSNSWGTHEIMCDSIK